MRARRDAGMHARSRQRGRSCRLQSARAASGRVGCYVGKFKFARGKGKQPRGRDMWATWTEQEWTGWRRDGGRERATRFNGQRNGRGRGRGRETPTSLEIEIDDMAMEMGRASPSMTALSPARIESRPPRLLMVRSVHLSSLPSFLSHFPLHSFIRGVHRPWTWMDVEQTPSSPPLVKCVVYRPCRPNLRLPTLPRQCWGGGRWAAFDFASTSSMTCAKKSSTTHLSRLGEVGPPGGAFRVAR